jgi:hypothetical protein
MVLYDWQRGRVPFFTLPPGHTEEKPPPAASTLPGSVNEGVEPEEEIPVPAERVTEEDALGDGDGDGTQVCACVGCQTTLLGSPGTHLPDACLAARIRSVCTELWPMQCVCMCVSRVTEEDALGDGDGDGTQVGNRK